MQYQGVIIFGLPPFMETTMLLAGSGGLPEFGVAG